MRIQICLSLIYDWRKLRFYFNFVVKPGNGEASMSGFKVVVSSGSRRKRGIDVEMGDYKDLPILDLLDED